VHIAKLLTNIPTPIPAIKTPSKYSETAKCGEFTLPERGKRKKRIPTKRQVRPTPKYNFQNSKTLDSFVSRMIIHVLRTIVSHKHLEEKGMKLHFQKPRKISSLSKKPPKNAGKPTLTMQKMVIWKRQRSN
jgi:hypothetical protein